MNLTEEEEKLLIEILNLIPTHMGYMTFQDWWNDVGRIFFYDKEFEQIVKLLIKLGVLNPDTPSTKEAAEQYKAPVKGLDIYR